MDSDSGRVASAISRPRPFTVPANSSSPSFFSTGTDSPVSADSLRSEVPRRITASTGTRSPGRTTRVSPGRTSSAGTIRSSPPGPPTRTTARSGEEANRSAVARRARSRLRASSVLARAKRVTTTAASVHSPRKAAPPIEIVIRAFIPRDRFRTSRNPRIATGAPPRRIAARKGRRPRGSPGRSIDAPAPKRRAAPERRKVFRGVLSDEGSSAWRSASSSGRPSIPIRRRASRIGSTSPR